MKYKIYTQVPIMNILYSYVYNIYFYKFRNKFVHYFNFNSQEKCMKKMTLKMIENIIHDKCIDFYE